MKQLVAILIWLICIPTVRATDYYIATSANGGNNSNNGSSGSPWLTLSYACGQVTAGAHTIHVGAGTFAESSQSLLAAGVSIVGQITSPLTSIIVSGVNNNSVIKLSSASEGTDGNQSISYLYIDGDSFTGHHAIDVMARKNVAIHHCYFKDFLSDGVLFYGKVNGADGDPTTAATGNSFHDNTIFNCARYVVGDQGYGNLRIGGQTGIEIYNDTIIQPDRGTNLSGYCIKFCGSGYNNGVKIHDCYLWRSPLDASVWDFAIELFHSLGGIEIYDNHIHGTVDFSSNSEAGTVSITDTKGYGFALSIHDNLIHQDTLRTWEETGIDLERSFNGGVYIFRNKFENLQFGLRTSAAWNTEVDDVQHDLVIFYNIFNNLGLSGVNENWFATALMLGHSSTGTDYDLWDILNNTIYANTGSLPPNGIRLQLRGTATNITLRNNIIRGFHDEGILLYQSVIDGLTVQNNDLYDNGTDDAVNSSSTLTNYTKAGNITDDPLFTSLSDFHLQSTSTMIGAGINVGNVISDIVDYDQVSVGNPPDIGAYEYVTPEQPVPAKRYRSSIGGKTLIYNGKSLTLP